MSAARGVRALTERLRAIAGRSDARSRRQRDEDAPRSRLTTASFEHTHRVWTPPDPPRRWFEEQGVEPMLKQFPRQSWWKWR